MKNKYLSFFIIFLNYSLIGQPTIEWEKKYGGSNLELANSIQQTTDNGYIVAGSSYSSDGDVETNNGSRDYWIIKLNELGNLEWKKSYGGSNNDIATSIQKTADGGYIVAGHSNSSDGDVESNSGAWDYWIVKLNGLGEIDWKKSYGGSGSDYATSIQQTTDGGYVVAGSSSSNDGDIDNNNGKFDYWILKLNGLGSLEWGKNYGGSDSEHTSSIQQTTQGGYIVAGYSYSFDGDVEHNYGSNDYWIIKLNEQGDLEWEKNYGSSHNDYANFIQQTIGGGYIVAGYTYISDYFADYSVIKLDDFGNIEWEKRHFEIGTGIASSIQQTTDGGYVVAGIYDPNVGTLSIDADMWIVKLDYWGTLEWEKKHGGTYNENANSIQQTKDGGYIVAGSSESNNDGFSDYWIVKVKAVNNVTNTYVWPGDLNYDGIVNNQDRSISYNHINKTGLARAIGGTNWEAQASKDWNIQQNTGLDIKHHDCDGNGNINSNDANAIYINYGKTHTLPPGISIPPIPVYTNTDFQILLQPINQVSFDGDKLIMHVIIDSKSGQNLEIFGGHFSIDYSNISANVENAIMNFESLSWLGIPNVDLLADSWHNAEEHTIEVGFTKTNGRASIGKGIIGQAIFKLNSSNLRQNNNCENLLDVAITKIGAFNAQQDTLKIEYECRLVNLSPPCCEPFINLNQDTPFQNVYKSSGTISTNGYLPIDSNQVVTYQGEEVILNGGFSVKAGAEFEINIADCK